MKLTVILSVACLTMLAGVTAAFPLRVQERDATEIWYRDTHDLAGQTDAHLRALIYLIDQTPHKQLVIEANIVLSDAMTVAQALALRHPEEDIRAKFRQFDRNWHRLHRQLGQLPDWSAGMGKRIDILRNLNERMHRMLRTEPAYDNYDRSWR